MDLSNPEFRAWWATSAGKLTEALGTDGIFIDGVHNTPHDPEAAYKLDLLACRSPRWTELVARPQAHYRQRPAAQPPAEASSLYRYADGCMIEWYDLVAFGKPRTPEQDLEFLRNAILLAKSGRIVWIKAWPYPYSFLDKAFQAKSYAEKVAAMNDGALFNVASYLVAEVCGYTFLHYSWGYSAEGGAYV